MCMNNEDAVLARIKELCEQRNWSTYRLAKESSMSYSTLNNLFIRVNTPTIPTLIRICNGLGISLATFFDDDKVTADYSDKQKEIMKRYQKLTRTNKDLLEEFLTVLEKKKV